MKIDFSRKLLTLDGKPIAFELNADGEVTEYGTLGNIAKRALMAPRPDGTPANGMEALQLFSLAMRIHESEGPTEVTAEEITLIKSRIAEGFNAPLLAGQAWAMLEE